ncbi:MAG: hypothetical protein ACOCVN_02770 [bacterium]
MKNCFILLFVAIICSCKSYHENEIFKYINKNMISHFPENCDFISKNYLMPSYNEDLNSGFYYKIMCREDNLSLLKENIISSAIYITKYNDSCSFIIDRSKNLYMSYEKCIYCTTNCFPIPRFIEEGDYFNLNEQYTLPGDFDIYILEAKRGIFFDDHLINDKINVSESWKHGMTRGIAISDKRNIVIYYIDIW